MPEPTRQDAAPCKRCGPRWTRWIALGREPSALTGEVVRRGGGDELRSGDALRLRGAPRGRQCSPGLHGEPEMRQDALDHRRVLDRRQHDHPLPAARTGEDIRFERPPHEVGPGAILRARAVRLRLRTLFVSGRRAWARLDRARLGLSARDHLAAPRRVRCQDAVLCAAPDYAESPIAETVSLGWLWR